MKLDFLTFYGENKEASQQVREEVQRENRKKQFNSLMKEGQAEFVMDWTAVIHQLLATAFVLKGVALLFRE